jgi:hypothetical protein
VLKIGAHDWSICIPFWFPVLKGTAPTGRDSIAQGASPGLSNLAPLGLTNSPFLAEVPPEENLHTFIHDRFLPRITSDLAREAEPGNKGQGSHEGK